MRPSVLKPRKAQISMEILFSVGVIVLFFTLLLLYSFDKKEELSDSTESLEKRFDCNRLFVNSVGVFTSGASKNVTLSYATRINSDSRIIDVDGYICIVPSSALVNVTSGGKFNLTTGEVTLTNQNNKVVIENV